MEKTTGKQKKITTRYRKDTFGNNTKDMTEEKITIKLSAKDIRDYDGAENEPEMQLVINKKEVKLEKWEKTFESEIFKQSRNANFEQQFTVDFDFSELQELQFQLYDKRLGGNFLIGESTITLGEFLGLNDGHMELELKRSHTVMANLELKSVMTRREVCHFRFVIEGIKLNNFGIINTISPLIKLWRPKLTPEQIERLRSREIGFKEIEIKEWDCVFKSHGEGKNPVFRRGILGTLLLCHGIWDCPLKVKYFFKFF